MSGLAARRSSTGKTQSSTSVKSRAAGSEPSVSSIRTATDVRLEKELNNKTRSGVEWVAELFLTGELMDRMEIDMKPYSEIKFSEVCLPDAAMLRSVLEILHEVEGKRGNLRPRIMYSAEPGNDTPLPRPASSLREWSSRKPDLCFLSSPPSLPISDQPRSPTYDRMKLIWSPDQQPPDERVLEHVEVFGELKSTEKNCTKHKSETREARLQLNRILFKGLQTPGRVAMVGFSICSDFLTVSVASPDGIDVSKSFDIVKSPLILIRFLWTITYSDILDKYRLFNCLVDIDSPAVQQMINPTPSDDARPTTRSSSSLTTAPFLIRIPSHYLPRAVGYSFPEESRIASPTLPPSHSPSAAPPSIESLLTIIGSGQANDGSISFKIKEVICYRVNIVGRCTSVFAVEYNTPGGKTKLGALKIVMADSRNVGNEEAACRVINEAPSEETRYLSKMMLMMEDGDSAAECDHKSGRMGVQRRPLISLFDERYFPCSEARSSSELAKILTDGVRGHAQLHAAGFLHRDVSLGNLLFRVEISGGKRVVQGILSDYDLARDFRNIGSNEPVFQFTGTYPFLSRQILDDLSTGTPHHHTKMDDFESFFFVGAIVVLLYCAEVTKYSATPSALDLYRQWNKQPTRAASSKEVTRPGLRRMFRDGHTSWLPLLPFLEVFRKAILTEDPTTINHDELLVILQAEYDSLALQP